ncbi:MAG TPA: aminoacyl-tRNA hydrolase, partial [bacterium]|nr:aminoacyl-tRNA hydrolase [bacterium]
MFIIVGLGNPGSKYSKTRHNAGFLFLDYLYNEFNGKALQENSLYSNAELKIQRNKVEIIKPLTDMNLSGEAVRKVVGLAKAKEKDLDLAS